MGFLSNLFGGGQDTAENKYDILRDDGVRAMQMGELPYAEQCLNAALQLRRDPHTAGLLAELYLRMQAYDKALPLLEEISNENGEDNTRILLLLAQVQGELKLYDDQAATCAKLLAAEPADARALYLAAEADHGQGNDFMAIAHLTQSLAQQPDYAVALWLRATILKGMGQWQEAQADTAALVESNPENVDYRLLHAEVEAALGHTDQAEQNLLDARELNPFDEDAILKLGSLYEQTSRWEKALELYNEALDISPDLASVYKARGGVKNHLKDTAGAADDLARALSLSPEVAKAVDGEFTSIENQMNDRYKSLNPYGF